MPSLKEQIVELTGKEKGGSSDPVKALIEIDDKFCRAIDVIKKLEEIIEIQAKASEEIIYWIEEAVKDKMGKAEVAILITTVRLLAKNNLEKTKQLMEGTNE